MHGLPREPGEQLQLSVRAGLLVLGLALALLPSAARAQGGPDEPLTGRIIAENDDRIDIDVGGDFLKGGDVGVIQRDGVTIGLADVLWTDIGHTSMRVFSEVNEIESRVGDVVVFQGKGARPKTLSEAPMHAGPLAPGTTEEFVPLLAPPAMPKAALTGAANVFHGRVRYSQLYQEINRNDAWYSASRLDTDGSVERLGGRAWSLVWSGNGSYRNGSAFSTADDYKKIQPHLYRLSLSRKYGDEGFVRLGRFYPSELMGVGYVDGAQGEAAAGGLRFGAAAGARPDRMNQGFASKELIAAGYGTLEAGELGRLYYSGTLGAFRTLYRGRGDELAAELDQRADLGPKLSLFSSAQADFDGGGAALRRGARLTRLNVNLNSPLTPELSFRAGTNHFEPLDTAADRELTRGSTFYLNNGYWRHWVGAGQVLPAGFSLDEDLSFTDAQGAWTPGQWRVGVGRRGLPGLPDAFASLSAYNLYNPGGPDYGATLSASFPALKGRLEIDPNVDFRDGPTATKKRDFRVSDVNVHANWRVTAAWFADAGFSRSWQDKITATTFNAGLSYRW